VKLASEEKPVISLNQEDITNIGNLYTNTRIAQVRDRNLLKESLEDEDAFLKKILAIEKERNDLLKENSKFKEEIAELKENVSKAS